MFCSTLPSVANVDGLAFWKERTRAASSPTGQVGRKWRLLMPLDWKVSAQKKGEKEGVLDLKEVLQFTLMKSLRGEWRVVISYARTSKEVK